MRIAIMIHSYYPIIAGAEVFAQKVAEYLVKKGNEVDVITTRHKGLAQFDVINNVRVHRLAIGKIKYLSFAVGCFHLLFYFLKLNRLRNFNVIHSVGDGLFMLLNTTIKKFSKKPHLNTIQGGTVSAGINNNLSGRILRKLQKRCFENADLVHVISRSLAKKVKELRAKNVVVIPNGVDDRVFRPMDKDYLRKRYGLSLEEKIIISVARLHSVKGINYLIKAIALLTNKISTVRLIVIGEGEQREELEELARQLNLNDKVQLMGFVQPQQIPEYLNLADVFVLPSIHEGLGIAILEAMACGVPVIGSNVDGIIDIVEHGKNGILVPPGNVKALAGAIEKLLQDKNLRHNFTKEGFNKVKERFLWDSILQQIEQIYISLVQDKKVEESG